MSSDILQMIVLVVLAITGTTLFLRKKDETSTVDKEQEEFRKARKEQKRLAAEKALKLKLEKERIEREIEAIRNDTTLTPKEADILIRRRYGIMPNPGE